MGNLAVLPVEQTGTDWWSAIVSWFQRLLSDSNFYYAGPMGMKACFNRILVVEDDFRSGYECETCNKTGQVNCGHCKGEGSVVCENCTGSGKSSVVIGAKCSTCEGSGKLESTCTECKGSGKQSCSDCKGIGETIVIPEVAKRRPTTGQIVSLGWSATRTWYGIRRFNRGDYVAYGNFCGEVWELSGLDYQGNESTIVCRMMKDNEVLCQVSGQLSLKRMKNRASQISG